MLCMYRGIKKKKGGKSVPSAFQSQVKEAQVCWKVPRFPRLPFQARLTWGSTSQNTSVPPSTHRDTTRIKAFSAEFWAEQEPWRGEGRSHLSGVTRGCPSLGVGVGKPKAELGLEERTQDIQKSLFEEKKKSTLTAYLAFKASAIELELLQIGGDEFFPSLALQKSPSGKTSPELQQSGEAGSVWYKEKNSQMLFLVFCSLQQWWQTNLLQTQWSVRV